MTNKFKKVTTPHFMINKSNRKSRMKGEILQKEHRQKEILLFSKNSQYEILIWGRRIFLSYSE